MKSFIKNIAIIWFMFALNSSAHSQLNCPEDQEGLSIEANAQKITLYRQGEAIKTWPNPHIEEQARAGFYSAEIPDSIHIHYNIIQNKKRNIVALFNAIIENNLYHYMTSWDECDNIIIP